MRRNKVDVITAELLSGMLLSSSSVNIWSEVTQQRNKMTILQLYPSAHNVAISEVCVFEEVSH